ncbi:MAG: CDP-alcohol phosphatidyltransferase family protein [Patescibacteria group bacterium]
MSKYKMRFANKISGLRILIIPFFISTLLYYQPQKDYLRFVALGIFLLAISTDAIDGYIARIKNEKTAIGIILDPLADKLLLASGYICTYTVGNFPEGIKLPLWIVVVVVSRDFLIFLGIAIIYLTKGKLRIFPSVWGKLTTFFQMITIVSLLLQLRITGILSYIMVVFTFVSGLSYLKRGINSLNGSDIEFDSGTIN